MSDLRTSICRVCFNFCSVQVAIEDGRVSRILGDRDNPIYAGYRCQKGADHRDDYSHPHRLTHSLKRNDDGELAPVPFERAVAEIAARIRPLIDTCGPRALAMYWGNYFGYHAQNSAFSGAFMSAIGSPMIFDPITIDQPGKQTARALHGLWMAPDQSLLAPGAALFVGTNPVVSHQGRVGPPAQLLRDFEEWGTRLIVIDPRRTEFARRADIHLQARPGSDAALLGGMLRVILDEDRYDSAFLCDHVSGLDALRTALAPFPPTEVARWAGVDSDDLVRAARIFADAERGYTCAGTGANMSGSGTLVEYLLLTLQTVCGFWSRAGDPVRNTVSLLPGGLHVTTAQAMAPFPPTDDSARIRVRGLRRSTAGMPAAALAEEILTPGEGQVRALLSLGGSPATALPDQSLVAEALRSLHLLVHSDIHLSPTARLADYVIATKLPYEMAGTSTTADFLTLFASGWGYRQPYAQYTPALVDPPAGSELVEAWEFLFELARELGLKLEISPGLGMLGAAAGAIPLDMSTRPTTDEILTIVHTGSRIPLEEVKAHPGGAVFPAPDLVVAPGDPATAGRLDIGAEPMMSALAAAATERTDRAFLLIARRARHVMNTPALAYPSHSPRENPAFLHPKDLQALGVAEGQRVEISSDRASITTIALPDDTLRRGVVAMTHAFGDVPGADRAPGANTGRLVSVDEAFDVLTGQPLMSAVPIDVRALP